MSDHDAAYGQLMDNPQLVEDLLRHLLPVDLSQSVDFSTLKQEETSHLAHLPEGLPVRREGDRLWSAHLRPGGELFFLFIEFQSSSDRWMSLRLLLYVALVWQLALTRERVPAQGHLPPVVPVVLYNGEDTWTAPLALQTLIDLPAGHPLWRWQPRFQYIMIDENAWGRGELSPGESLLALLFGFDTAVTAELARALLKELLERLKSLSPGLIETLWLFLKSCGATERLQLRQDLKYAEEGEAMLMKRMDSWEAQSIAKGMIQGERRSLLVVVRARFGEAAAEELQPLLANLSDSAVLDELVTRAARCRTARSFLARARATLRAAQKAGLKAAQPEAPAAVER